MTNITILKNQISNHVCNYIIKKYSTDLIESDTLGEKIPEYRTANVNWIYDPDSDPIISKYETLIENIINIPRKYFELPHIVKYNPNGQYKNHHDFFHKNTDYYSNCMKEGGQRTKTIILYLNDDFTGGETNFPEKNITVKPETGAICIWNNIDENNNPDHDSIHAGLPVISGTKYIMVIWVREGPFRSISKLN